jgi:flagella basal body P-ring formation protein FlgA
MLFGGFPSRLGAGEPVSSPADISAPAALSTTAHAALAPVQQERTLSERDLVQLLTDTLQQQYVKDNGQLELRLTQPWKPRTVPDEPLTLKILDLPTMGVTPHFVVRFELHAPGGSLGVLQVAVHARVWREVWVAQSALARAQPVADADIVRERRDMLAVREPVAEFTWADAAVLELAEPLQAGSILLARAVRLRPVVHRGQTAQALLRDGTLSITMKVEVLEDGAPGQTIRVRNYQTRRDIRGKVLNDQTILVSL